MWTVTFPFKPVLLTSFKVTVKVTSSPGCTLVSGAKLISTVVATTSTKTVKELLVEPTYLSVSANTAVTSYEPLAKSDIVKLPSPLTRATV